MKIGIRLKAVLAIILTSAFVGFIVGTPLVNRSITVLTNHELVDLKDETLLRGRELLSTFQTHRNDALTLSNLPQVRRLLALWKTDQAKSAEAAFAVSTVLARKLQIFQSRNLDPLPDYVAVQVVALDGTVLARHNRDTIPSKKTTLNERLRNLKAYQSIFNQTQSIILSGTGIGEPSFSPKPNADVVNATVIIRDEESRPLGAFMLFLDFGALSKKLTRSSRHLVFLVNEKKQVILYPDRNRGKHAFSNEIGFYEEYAKFIKAKDKTENRGIYYAKPLRDRILNRHAFYVMVLAVERESVDALAKRFDKLARQDKYKELHIPGTINEVPAKPDALITGRKLETLYALRDELKSEFGNKIDVKKPTRCERFAVQMIWLPYDPERTTGPDQRYFGMVMAFAHEEIERSLWEGVYTTLIIGAIVSGLVAVLMGVVTLFLTRPLRSIIRATKALAKGEIVTAKLATHRRDEIGELARSFQMMIDKIHEREGELRLLNKALDQRVKDRTSMLEVAIKDLEKARDKAFEAVKARDAFLATVSHELRTPLNHIGGYCQLLEITELNDEQRDDLTKVRHAADHLLAIINDILDYQKIIMGVIPIHPESFNGAKLIQDVTDSMRKKAAESNNQLVVQCANDVTNFYSDPKRLRQILLNLIGNSCKFTKSGEIGIKADRIEKNGKDLIRIRVADTGIGMSDSQLKKLFKPFSKVSDKSQNPEGTGLGLVISQGLARRMGGDIIVQSEQGRGTVFTITIAENCSEDKPLRAGMIKGDSVYLPPSKSGILNKTKTVLVVDDDPEAQEMLTRFLEPEGYKVVCASNGDECLQMAQNSSPSLITLDVVMPGRDGWEVLGALKSNPVTADIPVILLTMMDDERRAVQLGASEFVAKPIERNRILELVKRYTQVTPAKILVVDDDPKVHEIAGRILASAGHQIVSAENGQEGLLRLRDDRIDLVLLDLVMPVMDGFQFLSAMQKETAWSDIPVIVITAKDLDEDERDFLNEVVPKILQKSDFQKADILAEIGRLLPGQELHGKDSVI